MTLDEDDEEVVTTKILWFDQWFECITLHPDSWPDINRI